MLLDEEGLNSLMGLGEPMERFIQNYVDSFIKWEVIQYFYEHGFASVRSTDLAKAINRPFDQVKHELQELVKQGLLSEKKGGKNKISSLLVPAGSAQEQEHKKQIGEFVALCRTREGRLRVIYKILKHGKPIAS